jgi:hypothetical protein
MVNLVGSDSNGSVFYNDVTVSKVNDLLQCKPSDMAARAALSAWVQDVQAKTAKTASPDEKLALEALANAALNGEFQRAGQIIAGKDAFFARFRPEQVATFKTWTGTENNQLKDHNAGGWIVLPADYAAPSNPLAPVAFLPPNTLVLRTADLQDSAPPPPPKSHAGAPMEHVHLSPHLPQRPAALAEAGPCHGNCHESKPAGDFHAFNVLSSGDDLQQLFNFVQPPPQPAPPSPGGVAGNGAARAHASHPPSHPVAPAKPMAAHCPTNCHEESKTAVDFHALSLLSPAELEAWLTPDPNTAEGRVALHLPDPNHALLKQGDLTDDVSVTFKGVARDYTVILEPRHIADPKLAARVEGMYGAIVEFNSAAELCDEATRQLTSGWAWAKEMAVGAPPAGVLTRVVPELNKARQAIREGKFDEAEVALNRAAGALKDAQRAWASYGHELQSFLNKVDKATEYGGYVLTAIGIAALVVATDGAALAALGLEAADGAALATTARTATLVGGLALEGTDIAAHAAMGEPIDWARAGADIAVALLLKRTAAFSNKVALRLLQNPQTRPMARGLLTSLTGGALARATHGAAYEVIQELRQPLPLDEFMERVAERVAANVLNPKAIAVDTVVGAASGYAMRPRPTSSALAPAGPGAASKGAGAPQGTESPFARCCRILGLDPGKAHTDDAIRRALRLKTSELFRSAGGKTEAAEKANHAAAQQLNNAATWLRWFAGGQQGKAPDVPPSDVIPARAPNPDGASGAAAGINPPEPAQATPSATSASSGGRRDGIVNVRVPADGTPHNDNGTPEHPVSAPLPKTGTDDSVPGQRVPLYSVPGGLTGREAPRASVGGPNGGDAKIPGVTIPQPGAGSVRPGPAGGGQQSAPVAPAPESAAPADAARVAPGGPGGPPSAGGTPPANGGGGEGKAIKVDYDKFWPNPAAPNGPNLKNNDRISNAVGGPIQAVFGKGRSYAGGSTYLSLYGKALKADQDKVPAPGTIRVDDNTIILAGLPGGLEHTVGDGHAHPWPYAGRATDGLWMPIPGLTITPYKEPLIGLLQAAGRNALVALQPIPQHCGAPGGYYADPNPSQLSMAAAADRDAKTAQVYLDLFNSPDGRALAAKGYPCMTGLVFSEQAGETPGITGEDPIVYTERMLREYPGVFPGFGELTDNKELVGQLLGPEKWSISGAKFQRWLAWLARNKIKAPIILHSDWGHPGLNEEGRPAPIQQAYENVDEILRVFGDPKYKDINIIFAHTGIGRYVRPNAKSEHWEGVTVTDRATGARVVRRVPEHIAIIYKIAEKVPNAKFDISWNDVTQAYVDNPPLREALINFIIDNQDRVLFGSDTVKPVNDGHYNQTLNTGLRIFADIANRGKVGEDALWKLLRGNFEDVFREGTESIADWTHRNSTVTSKLDDMDKRNGELASRRADMHASAEADFKAWVAQVRAGNVSPPPDSNPGFYPVHYENLPDGHDHPGQPANLAWGPKGPGTPGGWRNADPKVHPLAKQAAQTTNVAAGVLTTVAAGLVGGEALASSLDYPVGAVMDPTLIPGSTVDALAFGLRGAMIAARALYGERLRLDWELIFEEGHVTRDSLNAFVSRIFDAAEALHITDAQKLQIAAATEQFWANYQYLAERDLTSYRGLEGFVADAEQKVKAVENREARTPDEKIAKGKDLAAAKQALEKAIAGAKAQRFNAIMAKVGEYQVTVDRILGTQASTITPFDAREPIGLGVRGFTLLTYLANDMAAMQWITGGHFNPSDLVNTSNPQAMAETAFRLLFALGNAVKTGETIVGLSGGVGGRLNETDPLYLRAQKWSSKIIAVAGVPWTVADIMKVATDVSARSTGRAAEDAVNVLLDAAFTYGMWRVSQTDSRRVNAEPMAHGRNIAWAAALTGGALILREILRIAEQNNKSDNKDGKRATPQPAAPGSAPVH